MQNAASIWLDKLLLNQKPKSFYIKIEHIKIVEKSLF